MNAKSLPYLDLFGQDNLTEAAVEESWARQTYHLSHLLSKVSLFLDGLPHTINNFEKAVNRYVCA